MNTTNKINKVSWTIKDEELFGNEQQVLLQTMSDLVDPRYADNALLPRYRELAEHYRRLLQMTRKTFRISDTQGKFLQQYQHDMQNLLDHANQGFLTFGADLRVNRYYSAECLRIFGGKINGAGIVELLDPEGEQEELAELLSQVFLVDETEGNELLQQLPPVFHINRKVVYVECKQILQPCDGINRQVIMLVLTDISDKQKAEEKIRYLSYHDKLTTLYNRAYIEMMRAELEKMEFSPLSVILIDMNGLKLVNDVFGHHEGDSLLMAMAEVLKQSSRSTDIVVRWGGDEFLILQPLTSSQECEAVCCKIRTACRQRANTPIPLSAAIGMATREDGFATLAELFSIAENRMYSHKLLESRTVRREIIMGMENTLHTRCFEEAGHSARVCQLAAEFATYIGLDMDGPDMKPLVLLSALHDIGKVAIPRDILGKQTTLSTEEWELVKSHSDIGYRMAQAIGEAVLAEVILALHERWDGKGYPYGIKGDKIPLLARLFSLIDVFDTVTHERPYGAVMTRAQGVAHVETGSGGQFDPQLTEQFVRFMRERKKVI